MNRNLVLVPLLALAGTSLSGCAAVAIPALAGSAVFGSQVMRDDDGGEEVVPAPVAAATPAPAPVPSPASAPVPAPAPAPSPVPTSLAARPAATTAPPPVIAMAQPPAPAPVAAPAPARIAPPAPPPAPVPTAAPTAAPVIARPPAPAPAPVIARAPAPAPAAPAAAAASSAAVPLPPRAPRSADTLAPYPDPATPLSPEHYGFARFVRYGQASAQGSQGSADLPSAILSDPVALDGRRRRCAAGEQPVVLIDLDPAGGVFAPPDRPASQPGLARGLALLREAGVEIAWLSDLSTNQSGALRSALEQSGLDPRGQDIVSLRRDEADTKQKRRESLAGFACIVAIAGDERADFDERFKYLRNPAAGAGLEPLVGDGWFLIAPLLGN